MRRVLSEWGFILSAGAFLALSTLYGVSLVDQTTFHFKVPTTGNVWHDIHMLAGNGEVRLFNQFEIDPSGNVRSLIVDLRTHLAPKDGRISRYTLPGCDIEYCRFSAFDDVAWSLRLSLLYPAIVALVGAVLCHRLGRLESKRRISPAPEESRR